MKTIRQKITSRKLWVAIVGVIMGVGLIYLDEVDKGYSLITTSIIGYLTAEGLVDIVGAKNVKTIITKIKEENDGNN